MKRSSPRVGEVFELLTITRVVPHEIGAGTCVECLCQCGNVVVLPYKRLTGGRKSCGHLRPRHGDVSNKKGWASEYSTWSGMIQRCTNPNHVAYADYGGRGINICPEWRNSYKRFLIDMGRKPSLQHSLERVDNNKGYEPSNCRWATATEQVTNRRKGISTTIRSRRLDELEYYEALYYEYEARYGAITLEI